LNRVRCEIDTSWRNILNLIFQLWIEIDLNTWWFDLYIHTIFHLINVMLAILTGILSKLDRYRRLWLLWRKARSNSKCLVLFAPFNLIRNEIKEVSSDDWPRQVKLKIYEVSSHFSIFFRTFSWISNIFLKHTYFKIPWQGPQKTSLTLQIK
jgi:hypothetical protein